jgi:predicted ATPase
MNLRQARFDDHWRRVYGRNYLAKFTRVSTAGLRCLADTTVEFSSGLSAIVGPNGVGKSTLVAAIAELLASTSTKIAGTYRARLIGSEIAGTAVLETGELHLNVRDGETGLRISAGDKFTGEFRWLEPSNLASRCLTQIEGDQNFPDLLESVTPLELDAEELSIASYLVGKKYTKLEIYEIADYGGVDRFPYFRAFAAGVSYGSEDMGRGELALLLTYWTLRDLPKNSILILEEPETHVSPRSQDCLMNVVAKFCDEKGIWVLTTTNSPTIIRRIPQAHLKLIARGNGPAAVVKNATNVDIALILGGGVAFRGALLVEDAGAKGFVLRILEEKASDLLRQLEVIVAGSESKVTDVLRVMPRTQSWLTLIGAYDGDMDGKIDGRDFNWPFKFLPGEVAPDQLLKELTERTANIVELLAMELHKPEDMVRLAINHAAGTDHHDYLAELAAALQIDVSMVHRSLVRIWLQNPVNSANVMTFIDEVRKEIDARPRDFLDHGA